MAAAPVRTADPVDVDRAELRWIAYAWPVSAGSSGRYTYVVDQTGRTLRTEGGIYGGDSEPRPGAALLPGGPDGPGGRLAVGTRGQDGNRWVDLGNGPE